MRIRKGLQRIERLLFAAAAILALSGCQDGASSKAAPIKFSTEYQAVHLDNGQVLFGKLENAGSDYPVLRNVFSAQNQVNPETKEVARSLVRRSVELHNPDSMVLNARHILAIEPVAANSRVAQVLQQAASAGAAPPVQ